MSAARAGSPDDRDSDLGSVITALTGSRFPSPGLDSILCVRGFVSRTSAPGPVCPAWHLP